MSDYKMTREAARTITTRYEKMLRSLEGDPDALQEITAEFEQAETHIEQLEEENKKLRKGLEIYQRERDRFRHANPEMTGAYFLSGGHGIKDDNQMPQFVEVVPAYGCGWSMIYEDTGRTISYEGS